MQNWASLALLALLAVFVSPALALACCCHPTGTAHSHLVADHALGTHAGAVGCCDGENDAAALTTATSVHADHARHKHAARKGATHQHSLTEQESTSTQAAPHGTACLTSLCGCEHSTGLEVVLSDTQNSSAFFPLVLGTLPASFTLSISADTRTALFLVSRALKPRAPDGALNLGRAPPVLAS